MACAPESPPWRRRSFALLAYLNGQTLVTVLAAAVLGAAAGFLRWNFKPAKIFMGDGGAMFLGFLMATLGLKLRLEHPNIAFGVGGAGAGSGRNDF